MHEIAKKFTSHGRRASVDCHGGTMHTTGFYTTYAVMMLGAMVGNLNYKGGMSAGGGAYKDFVGKQYNLFGYKGKSKINATRIDKAGMAYEKTNEFKNKVANGQNPYPAKDSWYPLTNALESEVITNSAKGYPYKLDVLMSFNSNFMYGTSGGEAHIKELISDPKKLFHCLLQWILLSMNHQNMLIISYQILFFMKLGEWFMHGLPIKPS